MCKMNQFYKESEVIEPGGMKITTYRNRKVNEGSSHYDGITMTAREYADHKAKQAQERKELECERRRKTRIITAVSMTGILSAILLLVTVLSVL